MALVMYRGPRPELAVSMPFPLAILEEDGGLTRTSPVVSARGPSLVRHLVFLFEPGKPRKIPGLFALGLALIRRRPSPWFEVHFGRGEWTEIAWLLPKREPCQWCDPDVDSDPDKPCLWCGGARIMPLRESVLRRVLFWNPQQITDLYAGEQKVMFVNGELVWSPPGWRPATEWP